MIKTLIVIIGIVVVALFLYSQQLVITKDCNEITEGKKYLFSDAEGNREEVQVEYDRDSRLVDGCLKTRHSTRLRVWLNEIKGDKE